MPLCQIDCPKNWVKLPPLKEGCSLVRGPFTWKYEGGDLKKKWVVLTVGCSLWGFILIEMWREKRRGFNSGVFLVGSILIEMWREKSRGFNSGVFLEKFIYMEMWRERFQKKMSGVNTWLFLEGSIYMEMWRGRFQKKWLVLTVGCFLRGLFTLKYEGRFQKKKEQS